MAFAIPGRWTGGKREEDEMRRLMAQEVEAAKARGEILEETSASDFSSNEEENNKDTSGPPVAVPAAAPIQSNKQDNTTTDILERNNDIRDDIADQNKVDHVAQTKSGSTSRRPREDTGNDADMDDTSMSSRASSRMLESINVISMDSMNVM